MRILKFLFSFLLFAAAVVFFHFKLTSTLPPLGKLLDPVHGVWQNGLTETDAVPEQLALPVKAPVRILYDSFQIPHIFAQNEHDLYLAQGYAVAQQRLWQMEFQILFASGRVSEVVGPAALELDRYMRRIGLAFAAENALEQLPQHPHLLMALEAYAEGVNAYVASLDYESLPPEYKLLDYQPEPWSPYKSLLLQAYLTHDLAGYDNDLENNNFVTRYGLEQFRYLFPYFPEGIEPVVREPDWEFEPLPVTRPDSFTIAAGYFQTAFPKPDPDNGSNNWAVSGSKTRSGHAILCNDTHLGLNLPSLWHFVQLHAPGINVMGQMFPGAPGVVIGFNEKIAFSETNSPRDVRDWYRIQFRDSSRDEYWHDNKWLKVQRRIETIERRGEDPFIDTVRYTHHGPVVYDPSFPGNDQELHLALRWRGHDPHYVLGPILAYDKATNYQEFREALREWEVPAQNVLFASTNDTIAIRPQGNFPLKWEDQGVFIMDGSDPRHDWQGEIPFEHLVEEVNPERGYVSSANQHAVPGSSPYFYYNSIPEYYRNRMVNRLLDEMDSIVVEDMMVMHSNSHSLLAEEVLPMMLDSLRTQTLQGRYSEAYKLLAAWEYDFTRETVAGSYFDLWWKMFRSILWDELRIDSLALDYPDDYRTVQLLKTDSTLQFYDRQDTPEKESRTDLFNQSFVMAVDSLAAWQEVNDLEPTWANVRNTKVLHLARLAPFSKMRIQTDGHPDAINSMKGNHGPSQRMIVHLDPEGVEAWGTYPGGQVGNPFSPQYDRFFEDWKEGRYIRFPFLYSENDPGTSAMFTLEITPAP